jgi:hypothetical protein
MATTLPVVIVMSLLAAPTPAPPPPPAPAPVTIGLGPGDRELCAAAERADKPWGVALGGVAATLVGAAALALVIDSRDAPEEEGEGANYLVPFILGLGAGPVLGYQAWKRWDDAGAVYRNCTPAVASWLRGTSLGFRFAARGSAAAALGYHTGLEVGLFLRPHLMLEVGAGWQLLGFQEASDRADDKSSSSWAGLGRLRALLFLTDGLFVAAGPGLRRISSGEQSYHLDRTDVGIHTAIGGRWFGRRFFGGFEGALYVPVVALSRSERDLPGLAPNRDALRRAETFVIGPNGVIGIRF